MPSLSWGAVWHDSPMFEPLRLEASDEVRAARYEELMVGIGALLESDTDWIAVMATVSCELHHAFAYYQWTGFYRATPQRELLIGPYQGTHGCLRIPFEKGVCGAAATQRKTLIVADVTAFEGHIACSASTRSELVVPLVTPSGALVAVLDVDSDALNAFRKADAEGLERLCEMLTHRFPTLTPR